MVISIECDIRKVAMSDAPDKFLAIYDELDDLALLLDEARAKYLLERLLERLGPVIEIEFEDVPLVIAA